ncbi:MAG: putative biopolymer transport protein TolR [Parachlamydiales bacterium]|nr:putative biopolymer transport protein TolR [Parachlamydiales bacterium]
MGNAMARIRNRLTDEEPIDEPLINLTPLIDVVFVVLITFMIIAPVLDTDRVQLAPGPSKNKDQVSAQSSAPLTITVHADNTIWVDHRRIDLANLSKWLQKEKKSHPRAVPKLIHDSRAQFGTYQTVKNTVEACGFEQMDVILQPK